MTVRVTFIHCPERLYAELQNNGVVFMPVWAYTLAAHLPNDGTYAISLFDTRIDSLAEVPEADIFLFSGINQDFTNLCVTHDELRGRFPSARTVIGGPICWSFDQAGDLGKLDRFDHIVIGDGEHLINPILDAIRTNTDLDHVVRSPARFEIAKSKELHWPLVEATYARYYGAVIEVSRGCPFLCEFCDIRVMQDNNRPHNKPVEIIMAEIDRLAGLGVNRFLMACDNFIGDPSWAESVVDAIIAWIAKTGRRPSFYTWMTINLYKMPGLIKKLRLANFDAVFIGIESFNSNSLIETAKMQNTAGELVGAIKEIQSYGLMVIAGLIFGFDSDGDDCFEQTLDGIVESGLLSGDPSLLTALPGTPLFKRMKMTHRLREVRYGLGGYKYQTNILYLQPRDAIIAGYGRFVDTFSRGEYQYRRLKAFFDNLDRGNYIPITGSGYINYSGALKVILRSRTAALQVVRRLAFFSIPPTNYYWVARALLLVLGRPHIAQRFGYLRVWFALWTNVLLRYKKLSARDFDIDSVKEGFDFQSILTEEYRTGSMETDVVLNKARAQRKFTVRALEDLMRSKESARTGTAG